MVSEKRLSYILSLSLLTCSCTAYKDNEEFLPPLDLSYGAQVIEMFNFLEKPLEKSKD